MAKLKRNEPPLYMPSSGSIVRMKFMMSSSEGKSARMVLPRESSDTSEWGYQCMCFRGQGPGAA